VLTAGSQGVKDKACQRPLGLLGRPESTHRSSTHSVASMYQAPHHAATEKHVVFSHTNNLEVNLECHT